MTRWLYCMIVGCAWALMPASADTAFTLVNGTVITGVVKSVAEGGLDIESSGRTRTYPWTALAPGTRYRYDQSFRMNLKGYLAGNEKSKLTNAPDAQYDPLNPDAPVNDTPEATAPVAATTGSQFDLNLFNPPAALKPSSLNALASASSNAVYWGFQFGPGSRDVVMFAFPESPPSRMFNARLSTPNRIATENAGSEGDVHTFSARTFTAASGELTLKTNIEWIRSGPGGHEKDLRATVNLTRGERVIEFLLTGRVDEPVAADRLFAPRPLLATPALDFLLTYEDNQPVLVGRVRMWQLTLVPGTGMSMSVNLDIKNANGDVVLAQRDLRYGEGNIPRFKAQLDAVTASGTYTVTASADLGPAFGTARYEGTFTLP